MGKKKEELGRVKLVRKRLSELRPSKYNPRRISKEAAAGLDESVGKFGLVEPIVWNRRTKRVVGGHRRLESLKRRGVKITDVRVVDLPELEEKALNLALNSPEIQGEFTPEIAGILEEIRVGIPEIVEPLRLADIEIPSAKDGNGSKSAENLPPTRFSIIVECRDKAQQEALLERFKGEGLKARGMKA